MSQVYGHFECWLGAVHSVCVMLCAALHLHGSTLSPPPTLSKRPGRASFPALVILCVLFVPRLARTSSCTLSLFFRLHMSIPRDLKWKIIDPCYLVVKMVGKVGLPVLQGLYGQDRRVRVYYILPSNGSAPNCSEHGRHTSAPTSVLCASAV